MNIPLFGLFVSLNYANIFQLWFCLETNILKIIASRFCLYKESFLISYEKQDSCIRNYKSTKLCALIHGEKESNAFILYLNKISSVIRFLIFYLFSLAL